ncbi:MAG: SUMF1/EgtB/PvdO family nonheme iron enzyme [Myxococcales bacterium]|nr:SUMF1/EgtB/PvdO family nonheme iron enzyme [Myxococcales bacterium]MCB9581360.1 SUMF1/EgtB/PvdO family nonheme iron enzyme [Polyangiaceae bacterium]
MPKSEADPLGLQGETLAQKYDIEEVAGVGGFSVVYRARHRIWKKPVAVKFFNALAVPAGELRSGLQDAFVREGALLAELSSVSTGIVQAWDVGTYTSPSGEWLPYMVLEWLAGEALDLYLERDRTRWSLEEAMRLLAPVASALDAAHQRGVAHRDVKPGNLLVLGKPRSASAKVKLLDFGVAKVMEDKRVRAALATTGGTIRTFTPDYGAPEQFSKGQGATGPWTDVYALALVLVELLAGRRALEGEEIVDLAHASMDEARRPTPAALGVKVPAAVEAVLARAVAVNTEARYGSAGEFWAALEAGLAESNPHAPTLRPAQLSALSSQPDTTVQSAPLTEHSAPPTTPFGSPGSFAPPAQQPQARHSAPVDATQLSATGPSMHSHSTPAATISRPVPPAPSRRTGILLAMTGALGLLVAGGGGFWFWRKTAEPTRTLESKSVAAPEKVAAWAARRFSCPDNMVKIPAGQFYMGSDLDEALPTEKPSFSVKLDSFCMDLTEVTMSAYLSCSNDGKCKRPSADVRWPGITEHQREVYGPLCNVNSSNRGDHPVNCVSWDMADHFCTTRGARLPTEAEWEYATRGPDGRIYPWGDEEPTAAHLNACGTECVKWGEEHGESLTALYDASDGFPTTAPVGHFPAGRSRFGPMDVVGNVWEWVADWQGPYTASEKVNPKGPASGTRKVIRGGGWNGSYKSWLRPSFRYAQDPEALSHGIGFRCAMTLPRKAE